MEKTRILIVEDEEKIAGIIRQYAEKEGFEVQHSPDGKRAIRDFEFFAPHLVLLDRMLPEKSGEEVLSWIKKRTGVPVIMVTAKDMEPDILDGYGRGADDYVVKPFSPRVLMARIKALLKRSTGPSFREKIHFEDVEIRPEDLMWKKGNRTAVLSHREFEILYLLARHPGRRSPRTEATSSSPPAQGRPGRRACSQCSMPTRRGRSPPPGRVRSPG